MVDDFAIIAITPPKIRPDEGVWITRLLDTQTVSRVHIRHPETSAGAVRAVLASLRSDLRTRVSLHDHHQLAAEFDGVGVHFNRRNPRHDVVCSGVLSGSVHSIGDLDSVDGLDYVFVSPVYDSISKPGYTAGGLTDKIAALSSVPAVALGGVTPDHFEELRRRGYAGAAMLGYFDSEAYRLRNASLQFVTNSPTAQGVVAQALEVLEGGCRWVQVRMKDADADEARRAVLDVARVARGFGATVIVDDRVPLAAYTGVDGVHLGVGDMDPAEARRILGPSKIIGMTVNTADRIDDAIAAPVDYYGVGPYHFTTTKRRLAPVLGSDGVADIIRRLKEAHPDRAIVVIGGVSADDVDEILRIGADGIAVSGTLVGDGSTSRTSLIVQKLREANQKTNN